MSDVLSSSKYELMYIIPATLSEEEAGAVETKISALITKYGATVESTKRLGKLRLAYLIQNQRHGYYMLVRFSAERTAMAKIDENLRISTDITRHMILRAEEAGEGKYNLVEYKEINLDNKEDRPRRRTDTAKAEDAKPAEGEKTEAKAETASEAALPEAGANA
jgi:small subunit ribosomal protein S6